VELEIISCGDGGVFTVFGENKARNLEGSVSEIGKVGVKLKYVLLVIFVKDGSVPWNSNWKNNA
jgi:hypothetical protein